MIKRQLFKELEDHLAQKEISLIVGPRQAGKTTLMMALKKQVEAQGAKTVFFNLDIEADRQFFKSQEHFVRTLRLELGDTHGYVFIDEIQRKEDAGVFLKGLYDMELPYKFIVSGSGSLELKERIHESLAGRKRVFELSTLSFEEFVNSHTAYKYEGRVAELFELDRIRGRSLLEEYLQFGGYPRVVLAERKEEKHKIINEIYRSYLERDIMYLLGVQKEEAFTSLVKIMASQIGNLVTVSELSSTLGISVKTVKQYLWYLEKTFMIAKVTPFARNARKELTKTPMFYFTDLGMRNWATGEFGASIDPARSGFLFENIVFQMLYERARVRGNRIHFWRTKDGAAVDFVVDYGNKIVPIEVKYKEMKSPDMERSFKNFIARYHPSLAFVINLTLEHEIMIDKTRVVFIPYYRCIFDFNQWFNA